MEETEKIARLKKLVDFVSEQLISGVIPKSTALKLVEATREKAERIIPHDMELYDLIYGNRFKRLIEQFILE
ncbi:MAG: hypothetical protein E3J45_07510 [Candidatus Zixiibacteriota bacterium]|nr:MAG: hypothetical protein E3J45_07510 [candidate division Zixibacteria bacterium]